MIPADGEPLSGGAERFDDDGAARLTGEGAEYLEVDASKRLAEAGAEAVREASREQRLVDCAGVLAALTEEGFFAGDDAPQPHRAEELLPGLLAARPDLAVLQGCAGGLLYHAPELMSRTFARILDRKGSPLLLLAGEIRANSRDYPRPVPVELFAGPPFDLPAEDLAQVLAAMAESPDYADIRLFSTDSGARYLFSTRHLEPGYALFLAQREESAPLSP